MDSRRLVVSRAASSLLSWRLSGLHPLSLRWGCLGAALCLAGLCEDWSHVLVGIVRPVRVASTSTAGRLVAQRAALPRGGAAAGGRRAHSRAGNAPRGAGGAEDAIDAAE